MASLLFPSLDLTKIELNGQPVSDLPLAQAGEIQHHLLLIAVGYPRTLPAELSANGVTLQVQEGARVN